jgi:hypothetical protein
MTDNDLFADMYRRINSYVGIRGGKIADYLQIPYQRLMNIVTNKTKPTFEEKKSLLNFYNRLAMADLVDAYDERDMKQVKKIFFSDN